MVWTGVSDPVRLSEARLRLVQLGNDLSSFARPGRVKAPAPRIQN